MQQNEIQRLNGVLRTCFEMSKPKTDNAALEEQYIILSDYERQLGELGEQCEKLLAEVVKLNGKLAANEVEMNELHTQLSREDTASKLLRDCKENIASLKMELADVLVSSKKSLDERDKQILTLSEQVISFEKVVDISNEQIGNLKKLLLEKEEKISQIVFEKAEELRLLQGLREEHAKSIRELVVKEREVLVANKMVAKFKSAQPVAGKSEVIQSDLERQLEVYTVCKFCSFYF